jgi:pimeloyl-ACP methyl ester carboxylesterase
VLAALVAVLAATLFTVPSATASPPPASGTGSAAVPQLDWGSCAAEGDGLEAFQCATAVVPLDYDRPKGKQITLALARLPAADPSRKIGSLFLNPGGPGGSGVDFLFGAGPFLYSDKVRARFDLVGFDPRGIIRSSPLRCFDTLDEAEATLAPMAFPYTRAEESGSGSARTAPWPARVPSAPARSLTTCRPPTWPATWTCCAGRWATPS